MKNNRREIKSVIEELISKIEEIRAVTENETEFAVAFAAISILKIEKLSEFIGLHCKDELTREVSELGMRTGLEAIQTLLKHFDPSMNANKKVYMHRIK